MINRDTSALTFTFQNELTYIEANPASYSGGAFYIYLTYKSHNYFGVADVTVSLNNSEGPYLGCTWNEKIVIDRDEDLIADVWEDANGGRSLSNPGPGLPCTSPSADCDDADWDEETSAGNPNDGDGLNKLREYRGVKIGGAYTRLDPQRKEIFLDTDSTTVGAFLAQELESQLDLKVYEVGGLIEFGAVTFPGSAPLEYQGLGSLESPSKNYLRPVNAGVAHKVVGLPDTLRHQNGEVVFQGAYVATGVSVGCPSQPWCQDRVSMQGVIFGTTPHSHQLQRRWARSAVFDEAISNVWNSAVNSIPESATENFQFIVAMPQGAASGYEFFSSTYSNRNLDGTPGTGQNVDPFDLLGWGGLNNDSLDGQVVGLSETAYLERVTLHEVGHALGIRVRGTCPVPHATLICHPLSGQSVMRSGFGPAKSKFFSTVEKADMILKPKP